MSHADGSITQIVTAESWDFDAARVGRWTTRGTVATGDGGSGSTVTGELAAGDAQPARMPATAARTNVLDVTTLGHAGARRLWALVL